MKVVQDAWTVNKDAEMPLRKVLTKSQSNS